MQPGHRFLVSGHRDIFLREIKYVQKGLLSDPPGMDMYLLIGMTTTGLRSATPPASSSLSSHVPAAHTCPPFGRLWRSIRTTSPLEGYHLHLRAAQAAAAKGSVLVVR